MMSLPSASQVDHLVLLVGSNPLPNVVAAQAMAASGAVITLIHSPAGAPTAMRLRDWLSRKVGSCIALKEVHESSPYSIAAGVQAALHSVSASRVGLNYTGGTKAMAVHAHGAVERWAKAQGRSPAFSYLDARTLSIVLDPVEPGTGERERVEFVGDRVNVTLNDLLDLHGWKLTRPVGTQPILPRSAHALALVNADPAAAAAWVAWHRQVLHPTCRRTDDPRKWISKGKLMQTSLPLPAEAGLISVIEALRNELNCGDAIRIADAAGKCGLHEPEDMCKWLDGMWLESAVLQALRGIACECELHDVSMNLNLQAKGGSAGATKLEFDVVAVRHYQLFAISCSVGKDLRKLKLLEAFLRAHQLGGDEARVALVCCCDDPDRLEQEVRGDIDPEGRTRVFGQPHLADLPAHLGEWIRSQSGKE